MSLLKPNVLSMLARRTYHGRVQIGKREVVGFGMNGSYGYVDRADSPYPAVRFHEPGPAFDAVLQKEKGDWKNLSIEEKKALYRYSYRQTFSEFEAPRGDWKIVVGAVSFAVGLTFWWHAFLKHVLTRPPKLQRRNHHGHTREEKKELILKRMIRERANPIEGIASKWDYENNRWK